MVHPFEALAPEYISLLSILKVTREHEIDQTARRLLTRKKRFADVSAVTGVPTSWLLAIDERESDGDILSYFGNGEQIIHNGQKTTLVPKGRGPFATWQDGAIDAIQYERVDEVKVWSMPRACYESEIWNGFGPRQHGRYSGYLWSGTSIYTGGKYVADGVWLNDVIDQQLGVIPIMLRLAEIEPILALSAIEPIVPGPVPIPKPPPEGIHNALWIQQVLNRLGNGPHLVEDGSYGRRTRNAVRAFQAANGLVVDGLVGPATIRMLESVI